MAVAAVVVLVVVGGRPGSPAGASATTLQAGDPDAGGEVWQRTGCGGCHTLGGAGGTIGPNLDEVKPSFDEVVRFVTDGTSNMPSFSETLSATEIEDVAAYVVRQTTGGASEPPADGEEPPAVPTVDVVLGSSKLVARSGSVAAGKVTFVVRNEGGRDSWFAVLDPAQPEPLLGKLALVRPNETGRLTLTLSGGTKVLACCARSGDVQAQMFTILRLKSGPPQPKTGLQLFVDDCGSCHTFEAAGTKGTIGPNLDKKRLSLQEVIDVVTEGKGGGMPAFGSRLTSEEIKRIAEFVSG